jgi:dual specificity tyrosine-phosphorylation-regulated kinase 2/3/4
MVEEEVPPVPAIPKAYESPKDVDQTQGHSYVGPRKLQIIDFDAIVPKQETPARPTVRKVDEPQPVVTATSQASANQTNLRHRRGLTVGTAPATERPPIATPNQNKRNLQPLMLPPLNLLPLGTPANNRISAFPAPSKEVDARHTTPPPKRGFTKTPSTPMTASKSSFFSRSRHEDDDDFNAFNTRNTSSSHALRSDELGPHFGLMSPSTPLAIPSPIMRQGAPTPFSSHSLPKDNGDFSHLLIGQTDDYTYDHHVNPAMVRASMLETKVHPPVLKKETPSTRTSVSEEPSTPASTTSLRRKLSLSWKRSSSKASKRGEAISAQNEKEDTSKTVRHKEMPPPRLPTSATWNSSISNSPYEIQNARPSLDGRFRKTSNNFLQAQMDAENTLVNGISDGGSAKHEENLPPPPNYVDHRRVASRSSSSSLLNPVQRMLGGRSSQNTLKARNLDTNLDKDDLAADKMMEKMASKRKDFDQAAKEVDELRRRAIPKEKISPISAIQSFNLNIFERGEIIDYKEVYFCGTPKAKKLVGDLDASSHNFGYDDDRGDYNIVLGDHLAYRYEVVDLLGKGSFGQVVRCIDHKTGQLVAIKIIRNKKRFHQQALVEVNILQRLREWVCHSPLIPNSNSKCIYLQ